MKVLHLSTQDNGGAGRAAVRLHQALLEQGVNSQMIVQIKTTDLSTIHMLAQSKVQKFFTPFRQALDQIPTLFYKNKKKDIFSSTFVPSNKLLLKRIKEFNPDIIHLHWINSGFINIFDLEKLQKPILWSLHDANPYTGGCHYVASSCIGVGHQCGKCPLLNSKYKYDISYFNFKRKQKAYKNLNLTINGLSHWIASEAKSSTLLKDKSIINLPNTINTNIFHPFEKQLARDILGIKTKKHILGFGAISGTQVERKGYPQLKEALELLPNKHHYTLVVFGSSHGREIAGIETIFLGHLHDDITLALLYSALDLFVTPSLAENLSNAIMESLSCGTPVVAFDIGGNSDMICHQKNGYLARDIQELSLGIQWCIQNLSSLSITSRQSIVQNFAYKVVSPQYIQAYLSLSQKLKL